jgi:thiamine pyridinylase
MIMILDQLVKTGAIRSFEIPRTDYLPFAKNAVLIKENTWGIPHWTCGYFLMTENKSVAEAKSAEDLMNILNSMQMNRIKLAGLLQGSWDSIMVYANAYLDTYPNKSATDALKDKAADKKVLKSLGYLKNACSTGGDSYCGKSMAVEFGRGEVTAIIGYSEELNSALDQDNVKLDNIFIAPAPLGEGSQPFMFTDALVRSRLCDSSQCRTAAQKFAEYYVSDRVFEVVLMSVDSAGRKVPRYLLPSTFGAFETGKVAENSIYKRLRSVIEGAKPYPNSGVPEARSSGLMRVRVNEALGTCPNLLCN